MAKYPNLRLDVAPTDEFVEPASILGTFEDGVFVLKHPYPDFDVQAGWVGRGRGVKVTFHGPREGQRIPCSRG